MRTIRTPKKKKAFLAALAAGSSVGAACHAAAMCRSVAYAWRDDNADFRDEWDAAIEAGTDELEDEARRRAMNGSDTLLIFMLKARRPAIYRPAPREVAVLDPELAKYAEQQRRIQAMTAEEMAAEIAEL